MSLIDSLKETLVNDKTLSFAEYMQHALYHPQFGYYTSGLQKIGAKGDFVTAPELSSLFGYTVAHQCQKQLQRLKSPVLFEFGAGSGKLCVDLLTELESLNALPEQYFILEVSADLQARQKEKIYAEIPHLANRVTWLFSWPDKPFQGVIIANEVLDAMPVHRFLYTQEGVFESYVELDEQNLFKESFEPCQNNILASYIKKAISHDVRPYQSEVNLFLPGWMIQCAKMLEQGMMLIFDYGFPRHEFYHPDRTTGTLMCHYQHRAHPNPFAHPGEEDITAHVDFTHVAESAQDAGFDVMGYTSQAAFLMGNGILERLAKIEDDKQLYREKQVVKQLLQENEMGEIFKVMALAKGVDGPLSGFEFLDRRISL